MKNWKVRLLGYWLCLLGLSGCSAIDLVQQQFAPLPPVNLATPVPAHPLYVLSTDHQLLVVDPATWQIVRRSALLPIGRWAFSRDPQGRIWIGYGAGPGTDRCVQIFSPAGDLLKTLTLCADPYLRIHFTSGRAFIPCLENGFHAALAVVDLKLLEPSKTDEVHVPDDTFVLLASGGNEDYFAMLGGGQTNRLILVKTDSLEALKPIPLPLGHPVVVLSYKGRLLLPNAVPDTTTTDRQDLFVIDPTQTPALTTQQLAATGALWATIAGDTLYLYHNPEGTLFRRDPFRAISHLDLLTNETEWWPLPDRWDADDIEIVNGEIILTHRGSEPETSGLYRFDPATGKLTLLVNIPGAQRILWVAN